MGAPYYQDDTVRLFHGDCLDVLTELPDASVDAVVTDPPYGLANTDPAHVVDTIHRWTNGERDYIPTGAGFMGKAWDAFVPPVAVWDDCLRILKPGGHLLAFAGSRTFDLMTLAIRMAGFEIRDSIAWLYGSGFPKSLDVSKAIDKAGGDPLAFRLFARAYAAAVAASSMTHSDIDRYLGIKASSCYWAREDHRGGMPPRHHWETVRDLLALGDDFDVLYDEAERAKIGERTTGIGTGGGAVRIMGDGDITAPATDAARQWSGWGTALKPGWEGVVSARKPPSQLDMMGSRLLDLENQCKRFVRGATPSSGPTPADSLEVRTGSAPESAATLPEGVRGQVMATGAAADSSAATDTSVSASEATMCSNIVTSWKRCWVELCEPMSTSITSTTSETTIDLKTLWSSLSKITDASTHLTDPTSPDGLSSLARIVDGLFAAALLTWRATRELTATEPVTSPIPPTSPAGAAPQLEPIVVARKPLQGTVAANVLEYGTGGLNIDGCRIGTGSTRRPLGKPLNGGAYGSDRDARESLATVGGSDSGRWPANVILDEDQAAALDEQSGTQRDGSTKVQHGFRDEYVGGTGEDARLPPAGYGGSGGASRYFYTAKASTDERITHNGISHPTVKPLDLMRWLVRLVTPPGGLILEPFAGSGTTVEAAVLEGFRCVAIEREADYLPLITRRIHRRRDPVKYLTAAGDDLGLFADEDVS